MDYGFRFEEIVNNYFEKFKNEDYASSWMERNERISLLTVICIFESQKISHNDRLDYFIENLHNEVDDEISIECLEFLEESLIFH